MTTVAEFFKDQAKDSEYAWWLWRAGLETEAIDDFANAWLAQTQKYNQVFFDSTPFSDLFMQQRVHPDWQLEDAQPSLARALKTLLKQVRYKNLLVAHLAAELKDDEGQNFWLPEGETYLGLYRHYAELLWFWDESWFVQHDMKLVPRVASDVQDWLHIAHDLMEDEYPYETKPYWFDALIHHWAYDGKNWAWLNPKKAIRQGTHWYSRKYYNKLHPKMKGFA